MFHMKIHIALQAQSS